MLEFTMIAVALLWVIMLIQGAALIEVLRQLAEIKKRTKRQGAALVPGEGLPTGTPIPDLAGYTTIAGKPLPRTLDDAVVLFVNPDCSSCRDLAVDIPDLDLEIGVPVVTIVGGDKALAADYAKQFRLVVAIADDAGRLAKAFNVSTTPSVTVVRDGLVAAHGVVNTSDQAAALFQLVTSDSQEATVA